MTKLYIVIPNYGLAIIVLTMLVRLVVSPLMVRQMKSAEKMRAVQPKVKVLQEKFKDDKQKQSEEMMKLWKEEGVNPLGGCLPLLLQFPVLIGLFFLVAELDWIAACAFHALDRRPFAAGHSFFPAGDRFPGAGSAS